MRHVGKSVIPVTFGHAIHSFRTKRGFVSDQFAPALECRQMSEPKRDKVDFTRREQLLD